MSIPQWEREFTSYELTVADGNSWKTEWVTASLPNPKAANNFLGYSIASMVLVKLNEIERNFSKLKIHFAGWSIVGDVHLLDSAVLPSEVIGASLQSEHLSFSEPKNTWDASVRPGYADGVDVTFDNISGLASKEYYLVVRVDASSSSFGIGNITVTEEAPLIVKFEGSPITADTASRLRFLIENRGDASYGLVLKYGIEENAIRSVSIPDNHSDAFAITYTLGWDVIKDPSLDTVTVSVTATDNYSRVGTTTFQLITNPVFTEQPEDEILTAIENDDAVISATAERGIVRYQWQYSTDGTNWTDIQSATASTYRFTAYYSYNGRQYRCKVSNKNGSAYSNATTLSVIRPPRITKQPQRAVVANGKTAAFSVEASGDDLRYQWWVSEDGSTYSEISVANTAQLNFTASLDDDGKYYRCHIWNDAESVDSDTVELVVVTKPEITTQPESIGAKQNDSVSFSIVASGKELTYKWQTKPKGGTWAYASSVFGISDDTDTLQFNASPEADGYYFRCIVKNAAGTVASSSAQFKLLVNPVITQQPVSVDATENTTATFTVKATGGALSYQWQYSTDYGETWYDVETNGNQSAYSFTADSSLDKNQYRCIVTNIAGSAISEAVSLTIMAAPQITRDIGNVTVKDGETYTFVIEATGGSLSYRWQRKKHDKDTWIDIPGATGQQYSVVADLSMNQDQFRCIVENSVDSATSNAATLTAVPVPVILSDVVSITAEENTAAEFAISAEGGELSYQWQCSTDNGEHWTNIENATGTSLEVNAVRSKTGYQYRCVVTNELLVDIMSSAGILTVLYDPIIQIGPQDINTTAGKSVSFSVTAEGGELTYEWEVSSDNGANWSPTGVSGKEASTYAFTASSSQDGYLYRCIVKNTVGSEISDSATLYILAVPRLLSNIDSVSAKSGDEVTFAVSASGGDLHYQWQYSIDNGYQWQNLADGSDNPSYSFTVTNDNDQNQYRCLVTNSQGTTASNNAILSIIKLPKITSQPKSLRIADGLIANFTIFAENGTLQYQWQESADNGVTWNDISNTGSASSYQVVAALSDNLHQYRCIVTNEAGSVESASAVMTVVEYDDTNPEQPEGFVEPGVYLPSEMADAIRRIQVGTTGTNLDEIQFGEMTEEELYSISTNPGSTDPKYYEEIAEAINELEEGINLRDFDIFIDKNITKNGEYVAFDDKAYGYATVRVQVNGGGDTFGLIDRTVVDATYSETSVVGSYAFAFCELLYKASFPECTEISGSAFLNCINLQNVSFPVCETIGSFAFCNCALLSSAVFPECKILYASAFRSCTELENVSFPSCLSISGNTFERCTKLSNVYFPICTRIGNAGFAICGLQDVSFSSCIQIGNGAFRECRSLVSISIPVCEYIGERAFYECTKLTEVALPACTYIGENAFGGCGTLNSIKLLGSRFCSAGAYVLGADDDLDFAHNLVHASIYVPESLYYSYIQAPNWSYYSSQFVGCLPDGTPVISVYSAYYSENVLYFGGAGVSMSNGQLTLTNSSIKHVHYDSGSRPIWILSV